MPTDSSYGVVGLFAEHGECEESSTRPLAADSPSSEPKPGSGSAANLSASAVREMARRLNSLSEFRLEDAQMATFLRSLYALLLSTMTSYMEEKTTTVR